MWKMIAVPVIGAIIGYATNWIAVKMLFKPRYEKYFLGRKLPFTPGVIPRGKPRLARAIGRAVEEQLLTKEVLEGVLLSDTMKDKVVSATKEFMDVQRESEMTIAELAMTCMEEEKYEATVGTVENKLADYVYDKLMEKDPGKLVTEKVVSLIQQKLANSMLGLMMGGSFLDSVGNFIEFSINEYMIEKGRDKIFDIIAEQEDAVTAKQVGDLVKAVEGQEIDLPSAMQRLYEYIIREKLSDVLKALGIARIVEDRVNAMRVEEVEELMLSIMKKELGAIVNLGALIGFALGLVNVAILLL